MPAILAMLLAVGLPATGSTDWVWPVEPPGRVIKSFVLPPQPWQPGHRGIDIAAPSEVLLAPADGVVRFAGHVVDRGVLSITHAGDVISSYEPVEALVDEGDPVLRGQIIGSINTGHCAQRCVHLGVRVNGTYQNPLGWLGGVEWPVLLPTRRLSE